MEIFCWPLHKSEKNAQSVEIFMNNEKSMDGRKNADREHLIEREKKMLNHTVAPFATIQSVYTKQTHKVKRC